MTIPLVETRDLRVHFPVRRDAFLTRSSGDVLRAVDGVSVRVYSGETLGVVGESGCGKSTLCRAILGLVGITSGSVLWLGEDLADMSHRQISESRRDFQIIFQDPVSSLNPRMTIGRIIAEPLRVFLPEMDQERRANAVGDMMHAVGLPPGIADRYPYQFSGGQCQRVGIARAMVLRPKLVVCDEPVSSVDVSTQAQIITLLKDLQRKTGTAYLFVSHDLTVVRLMCQRIMVMYLGQAVEIATRDELFDNPRHPYTRALLSAIPVLDPGTRKKGRIVLSGEVPSPINPPGGCAFHTRCPRATSWCRKEAPNLQEVTKSHFVACHHWLDSDLSTPAIAGNRI